MGNTALRVSFLSALGFFASVLCVSQAAKADDATISVLGLEPAAGAPQTVASAVTDVLRQQVSSTPGFRLVPGRDLVEVKLVFSCPDEAPACMTQVAQSIGAAKLIFGDVQPVGTDAYLVTLKLLDAKRGVVETWTSEQIAKDQATPAALHAPVRKWFATLTGTSLPGTIKVSGGEVGATVSLDGTQVGLLAGEGLTLVGIPAGPHRITVSKLGFEPSERSVTLASGGTQNVEIQLKASAAPPAARPIQAEQSLTPTVASGATQEEQPETTLQVYNQGSRVAAWALLGVGMVGVGVGIYSTFRVGSVNSNLDPYRRYPCANGGAQTCSADGKSNLGALDQKELDYVHSQQDTGDTFTRVQWVGYGVGGALLLTSAILFYHGYSSAPADSTSAARPESIVLVPSLSPNGVGALAYLRF